MSRMFGKKCKIGGNDKFARNLFIGVILTVIVLFIFAKFCPNRENDGDITDDTAAVTDVEAEALHDQIVGDVMNAFPEDEPINYVEDPCEDSSDNDGEIDDDDDDTADYNPPEDDTFSDGTYDDIHT